MGSESKPESKPKLKSKEDSDSESESEKSEKSGKHDKHDGGKGGGHQTPGYVQLLEAFEWISMAGVVGYALYKHWDGTAQTYPEK